MNIYNGNSGGNMKIWEDLKKLFFIILCIIGAIIYGIVRFFIQPVEFGVGVTPMPLIAVILFVILGCLMFMDNKYD